MATLVAATGVLAVVAYVLFGRPAFGPGESAAGAPALTQTAVLLSPLTETVSPASTATPAPTDTAVPAGTVTPPSAEISLPVMTSSAPLPSKTPAADPAAAAAVSKSATLTDTVIFLPLVVMPLPLPPYISNITARAAQIFQQGQALGNHPHAFALVGDSNTANSSFFAPFDQGSYALGRYTDLQATITYFQGSFDRHCPWPCSPAAKGSFHTSIELTVERDLAPGFGDDRCQGDETPLACEYRLQRPSIALILIGTGDHLAADWPGFEGRYRQIIEYTQAQGVIPVLITKADDLESSEQGAPDDFINNVIRRLSGEYSVPLLDLRHAVDPLPNRGLSSDNIHYSTPPDGRAADFTGDHLNYGFTMRNLTGLQVLDALRKSIVRSP